MCSGTQVDRGSASCTLGINIQPADMGERVWGPVRKDCMGSAWKELITYAHIPSSRTSHMTTHRCQGAWEMKSLDGLLFARNDYILEGEHESCGQVAASASVASTP